jgi:hypothetical protein
VGPANTAASTSGQSCPKSQTKCWKAEAGALMSRTQSQPAAAREQWRRGHGIDGITCTGHDSVSLRNVFEMCADILPACELFR